MGYLQWPFQFISTYNCSAQGRWWKISIDELQSFEHGTMEIHVAHAKNSRHLFKAEWYSVFLNT